jgi:hypothetical protein
VDELQRHYDLPEKELRRRLGQLRPLLYERQQIPRADVLHHYAVVPLRLERLEYAHNKRTLAYLLHDVRLQHYFFPLRFALQIRLVYALYRHQTTSQHVQTQIHFAKRALSQQSTVFVEIQLCFWVFFVLKMELFYV